jgi:hypothetical protein
MSKGGSGEGDAERQAREWRELKDAVAEMEAKVEALNREIDAKLMEQKYASSHGKGVLCAVSGWGAVSPAGWSAGALREAVAARPNLPVKSERRSESAPERRFRTVPAPGAPPEWMKHPRFRRTTTIARHALHAAVEALGEARLASMQAGEERVGIIFCTTNGCVQFSRRFYLEVRDNPLLASPILFPETVFNAPSSHLATLLGSREINYTLVGDSAQVLAGLDLATQWLTDGMVDAVLVVAADELDWLTNEAINLFDKRGIAAEGAAAVLLEPRTQANDTAPVLQHISRAWTFGARRSRASGASLMRQDLQRFAAQDAMLFDGLGAGPRADRAERAAWRLWGGERVSVRRCLGEGFCATSGWQTVAALEWIRDGRTSQAVVSAVGLTQQAIGATFGTDPWVGVTEKVMQVPRALQEHALRK